MHRHLSMHDLNRTHVIETIQLQVNSASEQERTATDTMLDSAVTSTAGNEKEGLSGVSVTREFMKHSKDTIVGGAFILGAFAAFSMPLAPAAAGIAVGSLINAVLKASKVIE